MRKIKPKNVGTNSIKRKCDCCKKIVVRSKVIRNNLQNPDSSFCKSCTIKYLVDDANNVGKTYQKNGWGRMSLHNKDDKGTVHDKAEKIVEKNTNKNITILLFTTKIIILLRNLFF